MIERPVPKYAYRVDEACAALGIGRTALYALSKSGELKFIRDGRLSPQQRACHRAITVAGGFVATAWDVDSALAILEAWGAFAMAEPSSTAMAEAAL